MLQPPSSLILSTENSSFSPHQPSCRSTIITHPSKKTKIFFFQSTCTSRSRRPSCHPVDAHQHPVLTAKKNIKVTSPTHVKMFPPPLMIFGLPTISLILTTWQYASLSTINITYLNEQHRSFSIQSTLTSRRPSCHLAD